VNTLVDLGKSIQITAAAAIVSGQPVLVGSIVGIAVTSYNIGDTATIWLCGKHNLPKAAEAWTAGAQIYWDNVNSVFTVVAAGNTSAGYAGAAQLLGDATGLVILRQ
jgi:predicted RecA/RadA family phage recombinase